jgi:hypothetical protein
MSATISKKIETVLDIASLEKAFKYFGLKVSTNQKASFYGGRKIKVDLAIPSTTLEELGFPSSYSTDIGINIKNGIPEIVADHMNKKAITALTGILPHFNDLGKNIQAMNTLEAQGGKLYPLIDIDEEEYGIFLEESENTGEQSLGVNGFVGEGGGSW